MGTGHDHSHASAAHAGGAHRGRLLLATALIGGFFVVELVGGLLTNSLALLSDAAHMFTDVLGMGMALAAIQVASRAERSPRWTFGFYRLEILAALANAVLLFGAAGWILWEAVGRLTEPPEVLGAPLLIVATIGLVINLIAFAILRRGAEESLNIEGAYLEVLADTLGSVGVIIAAVVINTTGFTLIDPILAVGIGVFVLPRTYRLGRKALRILIQAAPEGMDVDTLEAELAALDGVDRVHDLHVWTLTSGMDVVSVHLEMSPGADSHVVLHLARDLLEHQHGITHATIQTEPAAHAACEPQEVHW
jgi:cobalt-zinc-cadmium efflux system protein